MADYPAASIILLLLICYFVARLSWILAQRSKTTAKQRLKESLEA